VSNFPGEFTDYVFIVLFVSHFSVPSMRFLSEPTVNRDAIHKKTSHTTDGWISKVWYTHKGELLSHRE
jgi:hypothetical protein